MINESLTYKKFGYYSTDLMSKSCKKVIAMCDECKKIRILIYKSYRQLCKSCAFSGKRNPLYKYGILKRTFFCKDCNKKIFWSSALYGKGRCRSCSSKGKLNSMFGKSRNFKQELNPNWQGGASFEPYPLGWTKTFKEQIRYRDDYKCQICGCHEVECFKKLFIHHIDYDKDNIQPENLISLCNKCHSKTNGNRDYWYAYCIYIMIERGLREE